jgi:hypothetical protein
MKKLIKITFALMFVFVFAKAQEASIKPAAKGVTYGEKITAKGAISVNQLATKMGEAQTLETKISGKVLEICTKKGCWMKLENAAGETTMVTFKDYGFFMPTNIVGKTVVLDGVSKQEVTSVEEQKHYAEDAKKSKEDIAKITAPKKEIKFEAKGVLVM